MRDRCPSSDCRDISGRLAAVPHSRGTVARRSLHVIVSLNGIGKGSEGNDICVSGIDNVAGSPEQKRENDAPGLASKVLTMGSSQADTKDVPPTSNGSKFEGTSTVEEKRFGKTKVYAGETGELNGSTKWRYRGASRHKDVSPLASSITSPAGSPLDASSARTLTSSEEDDGGALESGGC